MDAETKLQELLEKGIQPYAKQIGQIAADGEVAVVMYEYEAQPAIARGFGWDGDKYASPVFRLAKHHCESGLATSDHVTARWLKRRTEGVARILVLMHKGSFLVNFSPERGYWIEPGSTDAELKQARN